MAGKITPAFFIMEIIIATQENIVECNDCQAYSVKNISGIINHDLEKYINELCPVCHSNLCTIEEYKEAKRLEKTIQRTNRWIGWLSIFFKKEKIKI